LGLVAATGSLERFGVGMDANIVTASVKALLSGVNRLGLAQGAAVESEAA
jgi:2-isopropylmalate synthase